MLVKMDITDYYLIYNTEQELFLQRRNSQTSLQPFHDGDKNFTFFSIGDIDKLLELLYSEPTLDTSDRNFILEHGRSNFVAVSMVFYSDTGPRINHTSLDWFNVIRF